MAQLFSSAGGPRASAQPQTATRMDFSALHLEVFEFLCTFHRVKRIQSKDTTQCGQLAEDCSLGADQRAELLNRSLYKILNEVESKIATLPSTTDTIGADYFDEWSFLTWTLLLVINRLESDGDVALLDYGGKHFQEKIHATLVDLVNKAHRMQPPPTVQQNDQQFERFYQAYVTALISLHELYMMTQQKCWAYNEFEAHVAHFKKQLVACFALQREFANCHGHLRWRQLREHQMRRMTHYGYENRAFLDAAVSFYAHMLYNLGVLAARIQGFSFEIRSNKSMAAGAGVKLVRPLLEMVYAMVDVLLSDSIICLEPSLNPILVTNNLFPMKIVSLCRFSFFRDFSLQIVSEEVAQQIQQEMRHRRTFDPPSPIRKTLSAALLAMKPATGVKRNNARASEEGAGGNTAHKKSDVRSREWISIPPLFDSEHGGWCATYPHLLCTTRQKDSLLDARSAMQTGKRPLFYFHVRAEMFSFSGAFSTAHTLSMPFTIATRRNQDCQVQRMMSSYTATCFWLYGTNVLDGLLVQWFDGEIEWKHFKLLYSLYFAMNAEVRRTFNDEDYNILQMKMHCSECADSSNEVPPHQLPAPRISFKNVLCPHLHFSAAKVDLRFSVWRGMLELLHLFNDAKTETRNLWEAGMLQGFLEMKTVHSLLRTLPGSGLVMRLSLVAGACVCITVKCTNGELLDLEPLDAKRLQAKNLHDYLKDIILAEKVDFVLDANKEWLHVDQVMRRCQKCVQSDSPKSHPKSREIVSNVLHAGAVDVEHKISFTTMRVAVVTCKSNTADSSNEPDDEFGEHSTKTAKFAPFEVELEQLLRSHRKSPEEAMEVLARLRLQLQRAQQPLPTAPTYARQPSCSTSSSEYSSTFHPAASSELVLATLGPSEAAPGPASGSEQQQHRLCQQQRANPNASPSGRESEHSLAHFGQQPCSSASSAYFALQPSAVAVASSKSDQPAGGTEPPVPLWNSAMLMMPLSATAGEAVRNSGYSQQPIGGPFQSAVSSSIGQQVPTILPPFPGQPQHHFMQQSPQNGANNPDFGRFDK